MTRSGGEPLGRLRVRREFLAAARGVGAGRCGVFLRAHRRGDDGAARYGVIATVRTVGGAVARNRVRRRLRALCEDVLARSGRSGFDYVLTARATTRTRPWIRLQRDFGSALRAVHLASETTTAVKGSS